MTTQEVAVVGETQRFECQVIGFPTPTITWYKDEVDITHNPRYNISFDEDLGIITLMIRNVSLADEGCYVCRAENSEGFATTTAYLVVRVERGYDAQRDFSAMTVEKVTEEERSQVEVIKVGRSTVIEEVVTHIEETEKEVFEEKTVAPKITYEARLKDQLSFKEGATVYLEVNFTGYPLPQVTWYHNDREIAESASVTMETMDGWSYLKVKGTTSQNAGIYRVVAENVAGKDSAEFRIVIKSPPSSPRNLRVVEVYKDYIIIAWDEPEHAGGDVILGYQVEKSLSGDKFVTAGYADAETTRFKVTKLFEGTDYIFRVSAENRVGFGRPATLDKPVKARLPFDPPSCPQNLRVKETNKDYITVAWDKPENNGGSDIIQYIIEKRDATRGGSMWIVAGTVDADEYSFRCTKLFQGNKYLFRVSAENRVGPGEAAELKEPVIAKLPYDKPMPPRNLHALETNRDYIVIAWEAPESDGGAPITNYVLEKHDAKHPGYIYMADVDANTFQYKATRLFEGYEYYFQVIAENQVGPSDPCETKKPIKAKLPFDEPDKPTNVRVKEYWTDYITVTWDAPANDGGSPITGYIIEKRDVSRQNWVKAGAVGSDVTTFKVGNLFEGAQYLIRVFAENKVGPSKEAAELDMPCKAKMPFDPPFAPRNLKVIDYNTDYITISWQPPENDGGSPIKGYVIEKHDIHMPMWMQAATVDKDTFSYKVENLFEGQSYEFRVAAENECGRGHYIQTERPTQARLPYNKPSAPRALRVTDVWKDYISLLWEEPESDGGSPLIGYTIEQRDAYEATYRFVVALGADVTTYQVTNLQEGHEYYFRIYSQNAAGLSERPAELKPPVKARLPFDKPSCPRSIRCTGTGPGAISIAWDTPESDGGAPITHYHVETCRTTQVNYSRVATLDATTTEFDITGLVDGADYYIRVYAENKAGESKRPCELDEPVKAMKPISPPPAPHSLRVVSTSPYIIQLAWEPPLIKDEPAIVSYTVEMKKVGDHDFSLAAIVDGSCTSCDVMGITEGEEYCFRVSAQSVFGTSTEKAVLDSTVKAKLPFDKPGPPVNLRVLDTNKDHITIAWDAPENDGGSEITNYLIESCSELDINYIPIAKVDGRITKYTARGLLEGSDYKFRVKARNAAGVSDEGVQLNKPVTAKLPFDPPAAPNNLRVTGVDKYEISLAWDAPEFDGGSKLTGYIIEMKSSLDKKYRCLRTLAETATSYTAVGLTEGTEYYFRIRAKNDAGIGEPNELREPVTARAPYDVPKEPKNLQVTDTDSNSVTISWQPPESDGGSPIVSYVIEMRSAKETKYKVIGKVSADTLSYTATDLKEGSKYTFRVKSENVAGMSDACKLDKPVKVEAKLVKEQKKAKEEAKLVTSSESEEKETKKVKKVKEESDKVEPKEEKPQKAESKRKESKKAEQKEEKTEEIEHKEEKPKKEKPEKKESEKEESKVEKLEEVEAVQEKPKKAEPKKKKEEKVEEKSEKKPEEIEPKEEKPKKVEEPAESVSLPSAPVDLMVESVSSESLTVKWSPSPSDGGSAILHYIIVMREAAKKKFKKVGKVAGNILSYSITSNLEPAKEYFIRVYAENSVGISESAAETKSAVKIPAKVTEVKEEEVKEEEEEEEEEIVEEEVEIVETKATEAEAPQQQEEAELKNDAKEALEEASEEQTISDTREKPAAAEKPQTVPSAPLNLIIKDLSSTSVTLSWEAPANDGNTEIISYLVVMREAEKNKFKKVGQTNGSTLSLTVTKVKEGREYYFRVYAENKVGISEDMAELEQSVKIPVREPLAEQMAAKVEETEQQKPAEDQLDSAPVSQAPVITIEPEPVTVMEGETIRLTCQVTGSPETEVVWRKEGRKLKASKGDNIKMAKIGDVYTLEISSATRNDMGVYTIEATNCSGKAKSNVLVSMVTVAMENISLDTTGSLNAVSHEHANMEEQAKELFTRTVKTTAAEDQINIGELNLDEEFVSKRKLLGPVVELAPKPITVSIGDTIKLICRIKGVTSGGLTWQKDGVFLSMTKLKKRGSCYYDEKSDLHILEIHNASDSDAGEYEFDAFNDYGLVSGKCMVTVDGSEADRYEDAEVYPKSASKPDMADGGRVIDKAKQDNRPTADDAIPADYKVANTGSMQKNLTEKQSIKTVSGEAILLSEVDDSEMVKVVSEEETAKASVSQKGMVPMMMMMKSKKERSKAKDNSADQQMISAEKDTNESVGVDTNIAEKVRDVSDTVIKPAKQSSSEQESETEESESTSESESSSTSSSAESSVKVTKKVIKKVVTRECVVSKSSKGKDAINEETLKCNVPSEVDNSIEKVGKLQQSDVKPTSTEHHVADVNEDDKGEKGTKKTKKIRTKADVEKAGKDKGRSKQFKPEESDEYSTFTSEQTKEEIMLMAQNGDVLTESMETTETTETMESTTITRREKSSNSSKTPKVKKISSRKETKSPLELRRARIMRLGPPQILMSPESLIVPVGDAIRLKYKVSGDPEPQVTWYKDGVELVSSGENPRLRMYHLKEEDLDILEILNSVKDDVGEYMLKASNEGGRVSSMVTVNVCEADLFYQLAEDEMLADIMNTEEEAVSMATKRESIIREAEVRVREKQPHKVALAETRPTEDVNVSRKPAPKFDIMPEPQTLVQGEDIKLSCRATGDPEPKVSWFKDDERLLPKMYDGRVDISWDVTDQLSLLEVRNVTSQDSGDYTAQAVNPGGVITATVAITVDDDAADRKSMDTQMKKTKLKVKGITDVEVQSRVLRDGEKKVKNLKKKEKPQTDQKSEDDKGLSATESESESETESESEPESASESEMKMVDENDSVRSTEKRPKKKDEKDQDESKQSKQETIKKREIEEKIIEKKVIKKSTKEPKAKNVKKKADDDKAKKHDDVGDKEQKQTVTKKEFPQTEDDAVPAPATEPNSKKEHVKCAPFFEMVPSKVICVNEGDDIILKCRLRGKPDPVITWYKDEKKIKPKKEGRVKVDWDESTDLNTLIITNATVEDSGNYTVKATNDAGSETCTVSVSVSSVSDSTRTEKAEVEVTETSGKADKIDIEFTTSEEETTEVESEFVDTEATLSESESSDEEMEEGKTVAKKKKKKVIVKMKEEVDVSAKKMKKVKKQKEKQTEEKEEAEEEGVKDEVSDKQEKQEKETKPKELETKLKPKESAEEVSFEGLTEKVEDLPKPRFEVIPEPVTVTEGETVRLSCRVAGQPKPEVSWFKGSKQFEKSDGRVKLDFDSSDDVHLLIINKATPEDAGQYTVVASNDGGTVSATVNVAISVPEEVKVTEEEVTVTTEQTTKEEKTEEKKVEKQKEKKPKEKKPTKEEPKEEKPKEEKPKEEKPEEDQQKQEEAEKEKSQEAVEETLEKVEESPKEKKPKEKKKKKEVVEEKVTKEEEEKVEEKPKEEKKKKKEKKEEPKEEEKPKEKKEKKKKEKEKAKVEDKPEEQEREKEAEMPKEEDKVKEEEKSHQKEKAEGKPKEEETEKQKEPAKGEEKPQEEVKEKKEKDKPKGPKFTKQPQPVCVTEGETFKLTCQIEEEAEVTWFKDTNKIKPKKKGDKKYKVDWDMDSDVYYLQVADATADDAGEYKVSAKSAKGTSIVKVTVTVEKKKVAPQIKGRLLPINIEVGEGFKLSCKVIGFPEPKVTWLKNKETISEKDGHYEITVKENTYTLKVKESVSEDTAEYTVTATSAIGSTSQSTEVTIKPKAEPVEEQTEKVEEVPVMEKSKLKPPEFVAHPDDIKVTECTELRILVTVKGSSEISVMWFMNGKPVKPNEHIKVSQDGDNYILSIPKCSLSDAGEYTCTAKDLGGESFCSVNVTVEESAEKRAEEEAHRELMEQLSPKIREEQTKIKESDMDMLLKEFAMLGPYTDSDKKVHLSKGDVVEVLDTEKKAEWLVRKQSEKEKVCYVPVELLLGKKPEEEEVIEEEESSAEDEETTETAKAYTTYTAITDYNPSAENKDHLSLKEGELVVVMDSSSTDRWWCRRSSTPTDEGWVPPGYLVTQTEEKLDTRTTQEVFREDVIKVSNKEQEAVLKRRYALKDLWESERLYIDDLKYCLDTYYNMLEGDNVPDELKNKHDTIFSTLPDIKNFHCNKFLDELLMTTNDADSIAGAFLKHCDLFQLYVPYFKERNITAYLLGLEGPVKFLKLAETAEENNLNKKSGNVGEKRMTLLDFLHRPWTRIDEYVSLLKDFIKYTAHANQDYSKLEEAVQMLLELKKQADDQQTLARIEGYPGNIAELGPILRHDDFTVWDGEPVGKGRERHLFLFKENLMLTKKKKAEKAGSPPTYEFKGLIDLPKTLLNEELDDNKRFELCFEDLRRGKFTFQAKSVPVKITWCDLLRQWLRKWGKKPTVSKKLEQSTVREGDPAVFSCHIEGQPLPEVTWYYNDSPIKDDTDFRIIADLFDFSLTIPHTTPENSGKYSLKAKNKFGEEELSAELFVKEIIIKPEFTSEMKNAEVLLGADARFDCKIKGKPAPDVKWYKGATEVKAGDRYKFLYPDDESYTLLIYKVEEIDLGSYECCAKNKGGKASQSAELIITDLEERKKECPPEFVSGLSDIVAVEGIQTKLVCRVIGYPSPEVTWYFNDKPIRRSDYYDYYFSGTECTLIIRIVHEEHMGKYTCKIKNKFGEQQTSADLKVATRPKFTHRFSNLEVFRNEKAQFVAKYQGFPKPDVTWYFEKLPMADSKRVKITQTETESVLTIDLVMAMDEGEYNCKLTNQAGEASCSAVLFVLKDIQSKDYEVSYAPTLVKKLASQEAIIGAPAKFSVKALGEPVPTAKWYKNGKEITETDRIHLVQEDNVYRLVFKKVEASDDGEYKCVISNKSGEVSTVAQLLTEEPKEPIKVEEEMKIELRELPPTLVVHKPDLVEVDFETIKLSWQKALLPKNAKPTAIKYAIDRKDISTLSGDWETIETGIEGLSMEIKNFNPEIDYLFRIRATNEYGSSDPSMAVSYYGKTKSDIKKKRRDSIEAKQPVVDIKKEPLPPRGPREKPQIQEVADDCLEISWQPGELPPHAIQTEILYIVERRNPPSKSWIEIASDVKETKFIMKNYKPEKDYMFRVRASNDYGISDPSMSATHFAKPEVIRQDMIKRRNSELDIKAKKKDEDAYKSKVKPRTIWDKPEISNLTEKTLSLKWKASGVPSYAVQTPIWYIVEQRQPPNVDWVKIATDVKEPELHNIRINRSKDYYWRVKAANEFGISEPSMPVMLKKKEEVEEPKEDTTRQRRRSRSYSREPADRGVPEHMRIPPEFIATPDENQYGVEGRTMKVIANIRAYPKPEVSWYMYGRKLQMGDRLTSSLTDKGELSLEIQQFCWSDVGEYKVEVRNEYGMAAQMIKVDMADPPTFLEPLHDQIFHLRGNSKLECRVHGIPYPTVTFKKDWRVIADSQRIKIVREEYDHWTLNIRNAIHLDEGLYECVAENVAGKVYCSANVKVTEKHGLWRDIKFNPCPVEDFFHVIDEIGRGSYGVVRRVIDKNSGNQYAAKILRYGDLIIKEELMTELEILAQLDHQNIVQVIDGYEDKKRLIIIMEIVTGGELLQRLIKEDTLTESEVAFYIRQLLLAVEYMHSKNVIHLDLKPENLYLSSPSSENLKVIDFSFARKYNPTRRLHVKYGTPEFVSPEVLCEEPVTPAADLWSVGVITYTLLSGLSPFHRDTIRDTLLAVRAGGWKFDEEAFSNISAETKDFISQLLVLDPKKRLTATEALDHPFINFAHRRGLGDRINLDRHKAYMFRRKWERGTNLVMTLVKPVPLSSYLIEQPPPEFEFEMDTEIPMLQLPDGDQPTTSGPTEGLQVELGAAGMLSLMGPPSMVSAAPSTVGSGGSSEWGREYEDEDTWYEFSSVYQTGVDTHLLPSKDTRMGVRMAGYRRTLGKPDPEQFPAMQSAFQPARYRGSMKERQDLRDLEKEREESEDVAADHLRHTRRGLWQVRRMIELDKASEGFPPIFKEKIKDKAYNVGDSCTLRVHVIGNPPPILSWYRNDELLSTGGRVRISSSEEGIHSLTVLQTKPNDFGVYKCVARNKYGTVTCRARMLCGDHPSRPGRPHVTKVSDTEAFMIWEEPESDGNSHIQAYKVDWLKPGEQRWTTATYCIDECALVKGLKPDTSYRFRVSAINAFGTSPYSWASVEVRTKKKGADPIEIEEETKRILLRSRQATNRPSPESSPLSSPHGSMTDLTEEDLERKAKDHGVLDREIMLQEIEPERFLAFGSDVWRGRYTLVKNVKPKQGRKVRRVAKILCYDESNAEDSLREYEMLKGIRQQHIVRLYEAYLHNNFVYLIFEKLYGENVARSLSLKNKYNEHHVTSIIKQVLDGLQFLHHIGIVHLNLQPDNVIMVSRRRFDIKLIDFGRARKITSFDGVKVPREGTAEFMAPEKVAGELVGVAADIWGVGLLAFILLSGVSPFEGDLDEDTFANILHVRYDAHTLYHNVTKYALKFIYQTLKRNPKARLTTEEALDHRWLMLNAPMVKVRKAAVFPTDKLRLFEENYIKRRLAGRSPPERLMNAYGIGLSFSSDEEGDDWLTAGSKY